MALQSSFWDKEARLFEAAFTGLTIDVLLASGEAGAAALPAAYRGLVDWDMFNRAALDWARLYFGTLDAGPVGASLVSPGAQAWARALTETTRIERMLHEMNSGRMSSWWPAAACTTSGPCP